MLDKKCLRFPPRNLLGLKPATPFPRKIEDEQKVVLELQKIGRRRKIFPRARYYEYGKWLYNPSILGRKTIAPGKILEYLQSHKMTGLTYDPLDSNCHTWVIQLVEKVEPNFFLPRAFRAIRLGRLMKLQLLRFSIVKSKKNQYRNSIEVSYIYESAVCKSKTT